MKRRSFFKTAAATAAFTGLSAQFIGQTLSAREPLHPGKEGNGYPEMGESPVEHLTTYYPDYADKNLWVRKDNQVLTVYRTDPNQKYPYLYPLVGPASRVSVTTETAQPWPHHRSVFMGVDRLNGGNYWQSGNNDGQILSTDPRLIRSDKSQVEWSDTCIWKKPNEAPVVRDERRYLIDWRCDDYYILDAFFKFEALTDIHIAKTNHGFYGVRVEQDLAPICGGTVVSNKGVTGEANLFGKPAKWVAFYGQRRFNPEITEGVAVFCPPTPYPNCPWFVRDYGNISPMPFNFVEEGFSYAEGETMDAVYRTVVFAGTPADVDLNGLWNEIYN
ncbi:MAG: DUF6807 family protein [Thermoguttaceae bacterium]|jgi:hypothetical protein